MLTRRIYSVFYSLASLSGATPTQQGQLGAQQGELGALKDKYRNFHKEGPEL